MPEFVFGIVDTCHIRFSLKITVKEYFKKFLNFSRYLSKKSTVKLCDHLKYFFYYLHLYLFLLLNLVSQQEARKTEKFSIQMLMKYVAVQKIRNCFAGLISRP